MAKKYGQHLVVEGKQLKGKMPKNGIGHYIEFDPHMTYVINLTTRKVVGEYAQEHLAHACGEFLDKADRLKLDNEMEKVLLGKND